MRTVMVGAYAVRVTRPVPAGTAVMVAVGALGYQPGRRAVTPPAGGGAIEVDVRLAAAPNLLATVRVAARRFRYRVNPAFGDVRPGRTAFRSPFQVTLEVSIPITPSSPRQQLDAILLPGRAWKGTRLDAEALRRRYRQNWPGENPIAGVLQYRDSVDMTTDQARAIEALSQRLPAVNDSVWGPLATYLAELPRDFDSRDAMRRVGEGQRAVFDAMIAALDEVRRVLAPEQIERLGPRSAFLTDGRALRGMRRSALADFGIR